VQIPGACGRWPLLASLEWMSAPSGIGDRPARIRFAAVLHNYSEPYATLTVTRSTKIADDLEKTLTSKYDASSDTATVAAAAAEVARAARANVWEEQ